MDVNSYNGNSPQGERRAQDDVRNIENNAAQSRRTAPNGTSGVSANAPRRSPDAPRPNRAQPNAGQEYRRRAEVAQVRDDPKDCATRISDVTHVPENTPVRKAPTKKKGKRGGTEADNTAAGLIKCVAYIAAVFVIAAIISAFVIFTANDMYAFVKSDTPTEIVIPENTTVSELADILHDNGIVKYKGLFKSYAKSHDSGQGFAAGTYTVSPMTSYSDLVSMFRAKKVSGVSTITFPEGYTTDEIIDLLVEKGIGEREKYVDVINNYDFDYWFIDELGDDWDADGRIYRLDGYLFPDTYQFYNASSEATVINKFLARFKAVFTSRYRTRAEELGYTVDEILTLASMIEKEAGSQSDFSNISSVFHNRLKNSSVYPYLNSDATVLYAIEHDTGNRPTLTGDDMDYDSPYNSYTNQGLVPGPIANPSNSAILAALNPPETSYYFFVSSDTQTYFSSSQYEHDMYVAQIAREREEHAAGE